MRIGIAHHFGWAVVVTASPDHAVVDRRRIELVEPGVPVAPIHTDGKDLDDAEVEALVARVRASAERAAADALDTLAAEVGATADEPIVSMSLRAWDDDFPTDLPTLRRVPHEARADSVMYRQVLAAAADERGWAQHRFEAKTVEAEARALLDDRADEVLTGPRLVLGPPWAKDHRIALAATILACHHRD